MSRTLTDAQKKAMQEGRRKAAEKRKLRRPTPRTPKLQIKTFGNDEEVIEEKIRRMPESCRKNYRKAMEGRSIRGAVTAFCLECVGYIRAEVTVCSAHACPLYPYRPYSLHPLS